MTHGKHAASNGAASLRNPSGSQQPCALSILQPNTPSLSSVLPRSNISGKIVVLNGFPGSGKLTILRRLQEYLPSDTTCLLDNHLLIDPVTAVIPDRSDSHHELRCLIRAPIFVELGKRAKSGHTILMTACLADNQRDHNFLQEHLDIAVKNGVPIYWINLYCDSAILEQRVSTPERREGGKTKLTDILVLRDILKENQLIEPIGKEDGDTRIVYRKMDVNGSLESSVDCLRDILERTS